MNAPAFDNHSSRCPVCNRSGTDASHKLLTGKLLTGLLTCQSCRERLVVSWSGHYVRDPFSLKCLDTERTLRRESRPLFRVLRDLRLTRSGMLMTALLVAFLVGASGFFSSRWVSNPNPSAQPASTKNTGEIPGSNL